MAVLSLIFNCQSWFSRAELLCWYFHLIHSLLYFVSHYSSISLCDVSLSSFHFRNTQVARVPCAKETGDHNEEELRGIVSLANISTVLINTDECISRMSIDWVRSSDLLVAMILNQLNATPVDLWVILSLRSQLIRFPFCFSPCSAFSLAVLPEGSTNRRK